MSLYVRNRGCHCARCRMRGLTGAAVLITLGVLFLVQEYWYIDFDRSWPVLLIVIGVVTFASRSASMEGHVQASWMPRTYEQTSQTPPPPNDPSQTGTDPQVKP